MIRASLLILGIALPLLADAASGKPIEVVQTELAEVARGCVIHVMRSVGFVTVEGWDRPEVELTVIKSMDRLVEPDQEDQNARRLERIRVFVERRSDRDLAISTVFPEQRFARWLGGKGGLLRRTGAAFDRVTGIARHPLGGEGGLQMEYRIRAPRDSRLVIHQRRGQVLVSNVTGDIEVTATGGDVELMLSDSGAYTIDAKSKFGLVSSDFAGDFHRRYPVGSGFARSGQLQSQKIRLRTGIGGITIKAVPLEGRRD